MTLPTFSLRRASRLAPVLLLAAGALVEGGCSGCSSCKREVPPQGGAPDPAGASSGQAGILVPPPPPSPSQQQAQQPTQAPLNVPPPVQARSGGLRDGGVGGGRPGDGGTSGSGEARDAARQAAAAAAATAAAEADCSAVAGALIAGKPLDLDAHAAIKAPYQKDKIEKAAFFPAICAAATGDSDGPCEALTHPEAQFECRLRAAFLRAAREPAKRADILSAAVYAFCTRAAPKANCSAIRDAVKANDPARCPTDSRESTAICGALVWCDEAKCPSGDDEFTKGCATTARWTGPLRNGGLAQLALVGTPEEQSLAHAAARQMDACNGLVASFKKSCVSTALPPHTGKEQGPGTEGSGDSGKKAAH